MQSTLALLFIRRAFAVMCLRHSALMVSQFVQYSSQRAVPWYSIIQILTRRWDYNLNPNNSICDSRGSNLSVAIQNSSNLPVLEWCNSARAFSFYYMACVLCGVFFFHRLLFDILHSILFTYILYVYFLICIVSILFNLLAVKQIKTLKSCNLFCLLFNVIGRVTHNLRSVLLHFGSPQKCYSLHFL